MNPLRTTGLRLLGDVPWGRHVVVFYDRKEDLLEVVVPFLAAGLASNEVCVWVIAPPITVNDAWAALREGIPALDQYRADRRIEILRSQTWYLTGDTPDLQKVERAWEAKHWAEFLDYEDRLNHHLTEKAMLVLCAYPIGTPRAGDVTRSHASIIQKQRDKWDVS